MDTEEVADRFVQALNELETTRNVKSIMALFAEDAVLFNPIMTEGLKGRQAIEQFWRQYRDRFDTVTSHFRRKLVCGNIAVLEWFTDARSAAGNAAVHYSGVSILEYDGQSISEFKAYFDTAKLSPIAVAPPTQMGGSSQTRRPHLSHGYGPDIGR